LSARVRKSLVNFVPATLVETNTCGTGAAGSPKGVIADSGCLDPGLFRAAFDRRPGPFPV
jgi:hypothetical protein